MKCGNCGHGDELHEPGVGCEDCKCQSWRAPAPPPGIESRVAVKPTGLDSPRCMTAFGNWTCTKIARHDGDHVTPAGVGWSNDLPGFAAETPWMHLRDKPSLSLLPWAAFPEVAEVMQSGVAKHGAHGWREPGKHTTAEYLDKALRHLAAHLAGVKLDAESGKKHLAHAAADLLIALELDR